VLRRLTSDLTPSLLDIARRWLAPPGRRPTSGVLAALTAGSPAVIGRSSSCDFVIAHDSISRRHAMLARDGDRVIVTDLGSTNGTFVNGRWTTQAEILPGDTLQLGRLDVLL
jgi:pSer/pThr/pTyr-binding forkhead associated (FHA) protein